MKIEEKPLHEVILDIMYFKNTEKPESFTVDDIFWQMKDPNISEPKIKEVLEWLKSQRKVEYQFGKYKIDKYEFLDLSQKYSIPEIKPGEKEKNKKTEEKKPKKESLNVIVQRKAPVSVQEKSPKSYSYYFMLLFLLFSCLSIIYSGYILYNHKKEEIGHSLKEVDLITPYTLYVSTSEKKNINDKIKDISYSFHKQNKTNQDIQKQIDSLNMNIGILENSLNKLETQIKSQEKSIKNSFTALFVSLVFVVISIFFCKKRH